MKLTIWTGRVEDVLPRLEPETFDACLCDPPYGLGFMGKAWDTFSPGDSPMRRRAETDAVNAGVTRQGGRQRACADFQRRQLREMHTFQAWNEEWTALVLAGLRPGAFLLAFGGTRTYHRLACAIEDAGFEIRDAFAWLYGQGYPKSRNISHDVDALDAVGQRRDRALRFTAWMRTTGVTAAQVNAATDSFMASHFFTDKEQPEIPTPEMFDKIRPLLSAPVPEEIEELIRSRQVESENVKRRPVVSERMGADLLNARPVSIAAQGLPATGRRLIQTTAAFTPLAQRWSGYGTALKPGHEIAVCGRKTHTLSDVCATLARKIQEATCQLAKDALSSSTSSPQGWRAGSASAEWRAVAACNTPDDLLAAMGTCPSASVRNTCLNIAWSWLRTLAEASELTSTFTTETARGMTTDLTILNSSTSPITPDCIIQAAISRRGTESSAGLAVHTFNAVESGLALIRARSAVASATSTGGDAASRPKLEHVAVAMKPLDGTFAANAMKHGVAGLNIDASRIPCAGGSPAAERRATTDAPRNRPDGPIQNRVSAERYRDERDGETIGRWPANVVMSHSAACELGLCSPDCPAFVLDAQSGPLESGTMKAGTARSARSVCYGAMPETATLTDTPGDAGGASRFFYCAKADTDERHGSRHPTLKPMDLCAYLARMLLPPPRVAGEPPRRILVPFAGAGSEVVGCLRAGWDEVVAIEMSPEFAADIRRRVEREFALLVTIEERSNG